MQSNIASRGLEGLTVTTFLVRPGKTRIPEVATNLEIGFELDRRWHLLRGEMDESKKPALVALARVFADAGVPYAIIGGVALQVHQDEPRTTLDIDLVVESRARIPAEQLLAAGFQKLGDHQHSQNWTGPGGTPVQITDDPELASGITRASSVDAGGIDLHVLSKADLLKSKLRSGIDPGRRRSKRLQDLADAAALIESDPSLAAQLSEADRQLIASLP